jgi:protein Mpv17
MFFRPWLLVVALALQESLAFQQPVPAIASSTACSRTVAKPSFERTQPLGVAGTTGILAGLATFWKTSPYAAAGLVCGFKASAADIVAQAKEQSEEKDETNSEHTATTEKKKRSFLFLSNADWKRNAAFITYGVLYQGLTQELIYNGLYPILFGTKTTLAVALRKVAFTLFVVTPLLTLPTLYVSKALIEGIALKQAARQYLDDIRYQGLLQKFYILWGPVMSLCFTVVPPYLRVTFIAFISFFWLIILSRISSTPEA